MPAQNARKFFWRRLRLVGVIVVLMGILVVIIWQGVATVELWNRIYQSKAETEPLLPDRSQPIVLPPIAASEIDAESVPKLAPRLASWQGMIRVDVTPEILEGCLSTDSGLEIIRNRKDGGRERIVRGFPFNDATPRLEKGSLSLDAINANYPAGTGPESSLPAPLGRFDGLLELTPKQDGSLWVGNHGYRGSLRILAVDGKIRLVNVLPLEDYIASVIDSEMPATFSSSARQAQAIVARSYALYHILTAPKAAVSDVTDATRHQRYLGYLYRGRDGKRYAGETRSGRAVADSTRGIVCVHEQDLLLTYYSACCGGQCNQLEQMYRRHPGAYTPKADPYCRGLARRGHGVGLCQSGANVMGQKGSSAEAILQFYYDRTELIRLQR